MTSAQYCPHYGATAAFGTWTDGNLLAAISDGQHGALLALYDRHAATLLVIATRIIGARGDAEDIVHDAFVMVNETATRYSPSRSSIVVWLGEIVQTLSVARARQLASRRALSDLRLARSENVLIERNPDGCDPLRVALVDDDTLLLRAAVRRLRGFRVSTFDGSRSLLAALDSGAMFDVVVTDLVMPESTGADLCAELERRFPQLFGRVIIATGGATTPKTIGFLDTTTRPILLKPYEAQELVALVREVGRGLR